MSPTVVRRFDLRVDQDKALDHVTEVLGRLVAQQSGMDPAQIKRVEALSLLQVRLKGDSSAVSRVMVQVAGWSNLRIEHDAIRVAPPDAIGVAPPDLIGLAQPAAPRPVGSDPRGALMRIGIEPGEWMAPVDLATPSEPVTVAIVDSGIMVDHPKLKDHLWSGTVDGGPPHGARCIGGPPSPDVTDRDGHGTMLAGAILAGAQSAPGVRLMAVKFFDADHLPGPDNGAAGIYFAVEHGAHIINLSWDLGMGSRVLEQAIQAACEAHALVVIAAGNSGTNNDVIPTIPACYRKGRDEGIITVMATDRYGDKASFSNYGTETVDLAAPGVDLVTTRAALTGASGLRGRQHRSFTGTSAAAATVSGVAALLRSCDPSLNTGKLLKQRLMGLASPPRGLKCSRRLQVP